MLSILGSVTRKPEWFPIRIQLSDRSASSREAAAGVGYFRFHHGTCRRFAAQCVV
jgi:hypothetical protein